MTPTPARERRRLERLRARSVRWRGLLVAGAGAVLALLALASPAYAEHVAFSKLPASPSNNSTPTWSFTNSTANCELRGPNGVVQTISATCTGSYTSPTLTVDGTYTLTISEAKESGLHSAQSTYVFDSTPPGRPTVTPPAVTGNSTSPTFTLTGTESGGTWSCRLTGPGTDRPVACAAGPLTVTAGGGDGTYTLTATHTDSVGNPSTAGSGSYVLDTAAPAAPTVTGPSGPSNDATPTFSLSGESGGSWSCTLTSPSSSMSTPGCSAGSFTPSLSGDGTWQVTVRQTDAAGNTSAATTVSYLLDTAAPAAPSVTGPSGPSNVTSPTFTLSGESGGSWACTLTSPTGSTTTPTCTAGALPLSLSGDGTWTLAVTQTDAAGNTSAATGRTYLLDTVAPSAPGVVVPPSPSNDTTPSFTLTGESGGTWACTLTSPSSTTTSPTCTAGTLTPSLSGDGTWTLAVTQTDAAGNTSTTTTVKYVLDTAAPSTPAVTAPPSPGNDRTPTFTLTGESGGSWSCSLAAPDDTTTAVPCAAGDLTLDLTAGAEGTYVLSVTQTDAAGNESLTRTRTYVLDTTPPPPPGVTGPAGPSANRAPTMTLTGEAGGAWTCTLTAPDSTVTTVACTAGTLTLSLPGADGTYVLTVTQTDAAGNPSTSTSHSYVLDTTAPPQPAVTGPSGPSNDRRPRYVLDGEPGGVWTCTLLSPGGTTTSVACAQGELVLDLTGGADGTWTLTVVQTDAAGNASAATSRTYLLDTTAPGPPGVSGPAGPSSSRAPSFTLTGEAGGTWQCTLTAPDGTSRSVACAAGTLTLDLTGGVDGTWTLSVRQLDAAGNPGSATSVAYLLDTTAPTAPGVTGPAGPSNNRKPSYTLTGEPGGTWACTLRAPDGATSTLPCAAGTLSLDLQGPDGAWTLTVTQTDPAGNTSTATSVTYLLDTSAPAVPVVTGPAGPSNNRFPSYTLSGEDGTAWTCVLTAPDGTTKNIPCAAGTLALDLSGGTDGTWTLAVTITDAAGNRSTATSVTYLLDTAPPAAPGVTGPTGPSSSRTPSVTLTGEPGGTWQCTLTAPDGTSRSVACAADTVTLDLTGGADGTWRLTVTQTDAAGNRSTATSVTYLLDTAAPTAPGVTGPSGPSNSRTPSFTLTGEPGGTWSCTLTAPDGSSRSVTCAAGTLTLDLTGGADGLWTLSVRQTDAAGNASSPTSLTYLVDTTAPTAPGVTGPAGPSNNRTPSYTLIGEPGGTWSCTLTAPDGSSRSVACAAGTLTLDLTGGADGTWRLTVTQTDAAGNSSSATSVTYLLDTTAPTAPTVTGPGGPSNDRRPRYVLDGEPGGVWTCTLLSPGGTIINVACAEGELVLDLTSGADGTWTLTVVQSDAAGNASAATSRTYLLDTGAPAPPGVSGPAGPSSSRSPSFTLTGEPGGTWSCTVTGPDGTSTYVACAAGTLTLDLQGPDGTWTLTVTQTDAAGNPSAVTSVTYLLDATAPTAPGVTGPAGPSSSRAPSFTLTGEPRGTWTCTLTGPDGSSRSLTCAAGTLTLDLQGPDGSYTLTVSQTDASGNRSTATSATYVLDTTAPTAPGVTGPSGPSSSRSPSFTLTGETGGIWSCTLTAPDGTSKNVDCAAGTVTVDLQGRDGTYTLTVTQTDAAGNTSLSGSSTYLLDTTAPSAVGVTGPSGPRSSRTPSFTLTGESGGSWTCTLTGPDGSTRSVTCAAGAVALDLQGPDGSWTLTVTHTDAAGNATTGVATYQLDTTAPATSVSGPAEPSSSRTPGFTLTGERGGTWTCTLTGPDGSTRSVACAAGTLTVDLRGPDGTWTLTATQTDAAGNASTATSGYLLDTTAPAAPGVTGPAGPSSNRSPSFTLTGEDGGSWTCTVTGPDGSTRSVACAAGTLSLSLEGPDGTWSLTARYTDAAGNASGSTTVRYELDTTAPAAAEISGPDGPSSTRTPVFGLTGPAGASWSCSVTGPTGAVLTTSCAAGDLSVALQGPDGRYTLTVILTDAAGNTTTTTRTYLLDATPPPPPLISGTPGGTWWSVVTDAGTTLRCSVEGLRIVISCQTGGVALEQAVPVGTWWLVVVAVDQAGNISELARVRVVREAAPVAVVEEPAPAAPAPMEPPPAPEPPSVEPARALLALPPLPAAAKAVVEKVVPDLVIFATTGQVADRPLSRAVSALAAYAPHRRDTLRIASEAAKTGGFPLLLLLLAFVFLAIQDRIDRNDPKLRLAPLHGQQDLGFRSVFEGATA